ncbi:hypothetical protein HMH01_09080 [Halovulum dunhuangense]|uniref:Sulfotransferase family protein n=1 Tax=Halovulum dunhuangense TaxID=1505036 RepID=A0A849L304_9RHOB|nr:hypothetical protein [Halovulum dunhuangense]NNU80587.1 hypothetical protein [Halovulum dunhuangense]
MLLHVEGRFAYLAMTKTGSTSVENAIRRRCHILFTRHHRVTHMPAHHFERYLRPYLTETGIGPIDTVCQLRHPVDWLESWWRYRSRPEEGAASTAGISFESFANDYMDRADRPCLRDLWRPQAFLCDASGKLIVDIVFRFEEMDLFARFLSRRLDHPVTIEHHNASPRRRAELAPATRARLEAYFAPELDIWESGTARTVTPPSRAA